MAQITVTQQSTAAADQVWEVMTDLEGSPQALSGIESVQRLDAGTEFGVGTRWRETRTMFGKSATEEMWVTAVEPGRAYTVEAKSSGAHYRSVLAVAPEGGGSMISMSFSGTPDSFLGSIMAATIGRLFLPATRKVLQRDLADIAAAAEAR